MGRPSDYKTKQKEQILSFIKSKKDVHVTASDIVMFLSRENTPVGTATVYRY